MKIRPVVAKFFMRTEKRTDGRTDVTKILVAFHNFCTCANRLQICCLKIFRLFESIELKVNDMLYIGTNAENAPYFLC